MAPKKEAPKAAPAPEPATDPFGPKGDRTGLPFIDPKTGLDPSSDRSLDADERLAWMEKQQEAMRRE